MLRLTLAQMRRSLGRLTAAGIAIAIGTAFMAATLLAGNVFTRTGYDAVTATYGDADVVVQTETLADAAEKLDVVRDLPDVEAADMLLPLGAEIRHGSQRRYQVTLPVPSSPRLSALELATGALPTRDGQIALPDTTAEALEVGVGDHVQVTWRDPYDPDADGEPAEHTDDVAVVGIVDDPSHAWAQYGGAAVVTQDDALRWNGLSLSSQDSVGSVLLVAGAPGVGTQTLLDDVSTALPGATVQTRDEAAADTVREISGESNALLMVVLGFAAIALLVAALVIANTFQVLVAQRTRTLALLRCVGAVRGQLRGSVLTEAAILGFAASVVGLVTGTALAQATLSVLGRADLGVPLPPTVEVTWPVVVVPLVVGTLVTVVASLVPARAATRVSPVAALRPADAPTVSARAGRLRLVVALLLTLGGGAGLVLAVVAALSTDLDPIATLGLGLLAGAASFVGVLVGAVFWVPRVVALVGRALSATGAGARLAAANTGRNPRRTAATSTALLIGVTLVAMMSAGAATARSSLGQELDNHYAVDLTIESMSDDGALPAGVEQTVAGVDGVAAVAAVRTTGVRIGEDLWFSAFAVDGDRAADVLRDPRTADGLDDSTVLLSADLARALRDGGDGGPQVTLVSQDDDTVRVDLRTQDTALGGRQAVVTSATLAQLAPGAPESALWVRLADDADPAQVLQSVQDALPDEPLVTSSSAAERVTYERVIDTLLGVVVGLLAVAVVIALIGVANTLSLSVIERRRESATLRAIGLTRGQLRRTLAIEGMLIAGVGAVLGVVLGVLYGWAGAATVFAQVGDLHLTMPWRDVLIVVGVALAAGLLASVLPARSAVRTSPVAALAVD